MNKKVIVLILLIVTALLAILAALNALFHTYLYDDSEYKINGIKATQNERSIELDWDDEDCVAYNVMIYEGAGVPSSITVSDSHYTLENIKIGCNYKFVVSAIDTDGTIAGSRDCSIEAQKLEQKITISEKECRGFIGDTFALNAKAEGQISFVSSNKHVANVDGTGNVTLNKSGTSDITVKASATDEYAETSVTIEAFCYPKKLEAISFQIKEMKDTQVTLEWEKLGYATEYTIYRYNLETKDYDLVKKLDGSKTSHTMARDAGDFIIKASATVNGKTVDGSPSNQVHVTAYTDNAKAYSSEHVLNTLTSANMTAIPIKRAGNVFVPESMCFNGSEYIVSYVNKANTAGALRAYDLEGNVKRDNSVTGLGHANGTAYNPNTGKIYTVSTHKTTKSSVYNEKDLTDSGSVNLSRGCVGIAYDESTNQYYMSRGAVIYVCDTDFNIIKTIHKKMRTSRCQDAGAYNGLALVCSWLGGAKSYIDVYRVSDGAYLGTYKVPVGEIESCVVVDGHLSILVNVIGSGTDYIYVTKNRMKFN